MILTTILSSLFFSASVSAEWNSTNRTCLDFFGVDFFGDGWDGARVYAEFPDGSLESAAPDCEYNPVTEQVCPGNSSGLYYFVNQHETEDYLPEHYWEIFWTLGYEGEVSAIYSGGYNTTMVWSYDAEADSWSLIYWENLIPNEGECDACGDAKKCKPKPKKKKPSRKKLIRNKKNGKGSSGGGKGSNYTAYGMSGDGISSFGYQYGSDDDHSRYGPPAVNVRVTMYDEEGDGWWQTDYLGTSWYISDYDRTTLFHSGTLCDGYSGYCNLCLGDGSYVFRATGENYNNTDFQSWDFCGVTGEYSEELAFHVKKGKCIADSITSLETICDDGVTSTVTVLGVLSLSGMGTEIFDSTQMELVSQSISGSVKGWDASKVLMLDSQLSSRSLSTMEKNGRQLTEFSFDVTFEASFIAEEAYGVDGRDYAAVTALVDSLADTVSTVVESSAFQVAISTDAVHRVQSAELVSLEIESITFKGTEEMKLSDLPTPQSEYYGDDNVVSSFNYTSIAIFFGAVAVGFVAFVGIMSHGINGYSRLSVANTDEVLPAEMDDSVSIPLTRSLHAPENRAGAKASL